MTRLPALPALLCVLLLSACAAPTYFSNPISPPGGAAYDERLLGDWAARDGNTLYRLLIRPSEAQGQDGMLEVTATSVTVTSGAEGQVELGWYNRIAYPSVIGGATYYNIRALPEGNGFVTLDSLGPHTATRRKLADRIGPDFASREFWLARPEISEDGALQLRFAVIPLHDMETVPGIRDYLAANGLAERLREDDCGQSCSFVRIDLPSGTIAELVGTFPDTLFGVPAGPFRRVDKALPAFNLGRK